MNKLPATISATLNAARRRFNTALNTVSANLWLRQCNHVGQAVRTIGRPYIKNLGRLEIGDQTVLWSLPVISHLVCGVGAELMVGSRVQLGHGAAIAARRSIRIGDGTQLGAFVMIMDTDFHEAEDHAKDPVPEPVIIGRDVQIGSKTIILPGSNIGDGARIDAGSVVSGSIPAGAFAKGVPARCSSARESSTPDDLTLQVPRLVTQTLGLTTTPALNHGPGEISAWDSLGTLKLILALEEEFKIIVNQDEWVKVRSIEDMVRLVEAGRRID